MLLIKTAEEMRRLGAKIAGCFKDGDVVLLTGEMGNGKSELARGIARGLGVTGAVPSPSYTILNEYREGALQMHHFDWYRVESPDELYELGAEDVIGAKGLTLIEWHERAPELIPEACLEILIHRLPDDTRRVEFLPRGGFPMPQID